MGSLGMENGGVASLSGASALQSRVKKEPLPELPLSATSPDQIDSTIEQLRIKSEPLSDTQLSPVSENTEVSIKEEPDIKDNDNIDILSIEPQFDHKDAIKKLLDINMGPGFNVSDINTEPTSAFRTLQEIKGTVITAAVSSKNGHQPNLENWRKVKIFLCVISRIDPVEPKFSKPLKLKDVLELFANPLFKCPKEYSSIAKALIDRIEAQNGFEAPPPPPPLPAAPLAVDPQSANANKNKKRKSVDESPISSKKPRDNSTSEDNSALRNSTSGPVAPVQLPPSNHLIWGDSGIMRGCLLNLSIRKDFKAKDCKIYGHNGLTVGDCWARQIAALRDGAHGAPQAGIVGDVEEGAYSIIISKHYEGFDVDEGDTIEYSAPGAIDSTAKEPESTKHGVIVLKRSIVTKNPVRVLRTAGCAWKNGPAMGIRYDGLYRVIEGKVGTNGKGGKYWRFTLKRLRRVDGSDQVPINISRPTKEEVGLFEKVKEGY
ncbi:putative ydg sra domain-containing protein [Botrytis fragariae]|uniref:Putative ydg sra domain-containing protein n=1 Tax=Botrytis fragariae TaxID=1964551 RepID=A0A8H6B2U3_9HELO|nr:putative ydg sra domain-containing protein [Botrytis fragariae]KAF5878453.1 putative ydg sra domain-containing protein [Botrytis fragariae]